MYIIVDCSKMYVKMKYVKIYNILPTFRFKCPEAGVYIDMSTGVPILRA